MSEQKEKTRDSVVAHLGALKNMGAENVFVGAVRERIVVEKRAIPAPAPQPSTNNHQPSTINSLEDLRANIGDCTRCKLCKGRTNLVFGVGNPKAKLMFIGEAPGADEDAQGIPFVGRAGQLLTKIIEGMGLKREDVYIANVAKCRPPENRNPEPDEIAACMPFLKQQIEIIKPKVIMCLGKFAAQTVLDTQVTISKLRGTFQDVNGVAVMPAFHPAYLLRNPSMKRIMWEDCKLVMAKLSEL